MMSFIEYNKNLILEVEQMATSRQHQESHGIGQIEQQLDNQAEAAVNIQGKNELDQKVTSAASHQDSELDEIENNKDNGQYIQ
jgi:hypothetical protein